MAGLRCATCVCAQAAPCVSSWTMIVPQRRGSAGGMCWTLHTRGPIGMAGDRAVPHRDDCPRNFPSCPIPPPALQQLLLLADFCLPHCTHSRHFSQLLALSSTFASPSCRAHLRTHLRCFLSQYVQASRAAETTVQHGERGGKKESWQQQWQGKHTLKRGVRERVVEGEQEQLVQQQHLLREEHQRWLCLPLTSSHPTHLLAPHSPPPTPLTSSYPTHPLPPHSPPPTLLTSSHPTHLLLPPHSPPPVPRSSLLPSPTVILLCLPSSPHLLPHHPSQAAAPMPSHLQAASSPPSHITYTWSA
ncbi:unnamed protein product [Closterium sp. Naga37s-1]|nr:unnamed protein product [Closterium sp. Naga37s-1]